MSPPSYVHVSEIDLEWYFSAQQSLMEKSLEQHRETFHPSKREMVDTVESKKVRLPFISNLAWNTS